MSEKLRRSFNSQSDFGELPLWPQMPIRSPMTAILDFKGNEPRLSSWSIQSST